MGIGHVKGEIMATYLVTGGAGFIGSHLVDALLKEGHTVLCVDNLSTGKVENIAHVELNDRFSFFKADIRDLETMRGLMKGVDYVFHEAALGSVQRSVDDPLTTHEVNATGTLHVFIAARESAVKRVVYASSSSVYGDSETLPKVESMMPSPKSPYAVSKLVGEHYASVFTDLYGLEVVSLRYFNVFGPRQDPFSDYAAVIPIFIRQLLRGESPTIFGDGTQSRDFTYVGNVVRANLLASEAKGAGGKVFNVACGERMDLNTLLSHLKILLAPYKDGVEALEPIYGPPRPGDVKHSLAGIDVAKAWIGYIPEFSVEEGLKDSIKWYVENLQ
jgi:nucleoside-diphosphate-sugar epimerase